MADATGSDLTPPLREKLARLKEIVTSLDSALIAFSGGVDSSLLLHVARECLGDRCVAVTAAGPAHPEREREAAVALAERIGAEHVVIDVDQLALPGFRENGPDRCYDCKRELLVRLRGLAEERGLKSVAEGTHADDTGDHRPGMRAVEELGVRSPLKEAGLGKDDIRLISRALGLATWDAPSRACLASRIPYGQTITAENLRQVDRAEALLESMGFRQCRVRHHGQVARVEVPARDLRRLLDDAVRETIVGKLKCFGFTYVALDLEGYRSGAMNEAL